MNKRNWFENFAFPLSFVRPRNARKATWVRQNISRKLLIWNSKPEDISIVYWQASFLLEYSSVFVPVTFYLLL